jgi:hypothetical protein
MAYNNIMLRKSFKLDLVSFAFAALNLLQVMMELTILRCYQNKGVNLEQRIKFSSKMRALDLAKIGIAASVLGAAFFAMGWFLFKKQGCEKAFFTIDDIRCFDCREIFGD